MSGQTVAVGQVHYMQLQAWAGIKSQFGWKTEQIHSDSLVKDIIVYKRSVPGVGKFFYIPGLNGVDALTAKSFTKEVKQCYAGKGFAIRLELDQQRDDAVLHSLREAGWKKIQKHIQYRHTVIVQLTGSEEDVWMSMKSRARYEVLQAQKSGVVIEQAEPNEENLRKMYDLMQVTSNRNKFYIRDMKFTMAYWRKFSELGQLKLFFATHKGDILSGAIILTSGTKAWYKDGGSTRTKANLMGARLLQWEAMKSLQHDGITIYDLGGIPATESHQTSSMHGLYVFKTAYSKITTELIPTLELPLNKRYALWPKAEKQWLRVYNLFAHSLWY